MENKVVHKIPPFLPISIAFMGDRRLKRLNKDLPNCQGIGIVFSIFLELVKEKNLSYPLNDIDILADQINTSIALTTTVISNYDLFDFFEDKSGKKFFSADLKILLEPYYRKVETNRQNAKIGAKTKELKTKSHLLVLENKLSALDSSQRPQSDGSANIIDYNLNNIGKDTISIIDFKKFREKLLKEYPNFIFSLPLKFGYSKDHKGFCLKNSYIYNLHTNKILDKNESFKIWQYLYEIQDDVFQLAQKQIMKEVVQ